MIDIVNRWAYSFRRDEYEKQDQARREKALRYLRVKYPEVEEGVFFTDRAGQLHPEVISYRAVAQAAEIEEICDTCEGGVCGVPEAVKGKDSRPVVKVSQSPRGYSYLEVRWTCGFGCKYESQYGEKYKKSGIKNTDMTFGNYKFVRTSPGTLRAKTAAIEAAQGGTNLILAGRPGTGKTHLAVAIAIYAMERGEQALFRLVSAMLDEIQREIRDSWSTTIDHRRVWKLVEGRSNRAFTDEDEATRVFEEAGFDPYEKRLKSLTAMETAMGKKRFREVMGGLIMKPQGKPTLVARSDKREEIRMEV